MKKILPYPKMLLAALFLGLAGIGAWATGHLGRIGSVPARAATEPADILATLPLPTGNSATEIAIGKWTAKARENRGDARALVNLGDALMQHVRENADATYYGHAEQVYIKALELDPGNGEAMTGLAWVNGGRHNFPKSIEWGNKALAVNDRNNLACGLIGDAHLELGDYDAAFKDYQKMLDLRPDISSYSRGAHLLHITGQLFHAAWLMRKAIDSGSAFAENTAWCRAQLGLIYFSDGNVVAAEQELADALQKTPDNRHVLAAMGRVKAARKDYPAAIALYKKAAAIVPEHETLIALGDLYAVTGNQTEAEKQYALVEDLHRKSHAASDTTHNFPMAQFYADHDRNLVESLRLAEQNKLTRNVFEADILAWCYYKNNEPDLAKATIRRALARKTADAKILYHAGMIYAAAGDCTIGRQYLSRALSLNPNFSPIHARIAADTLLKLGHQTTARGNSVGAAQ